MLEPLDGLRRADQTAGAPPVDVHLSRLLVHLAHGIAAAGRTFVRKNIRLGASWPFFQDHAHDLRDHVACPLHDDRIAEADILSRDFVFIVQRRVLHHHAADCDRLELRDGRELSRASHLNLDVIQDRVCLLGREFVRDGPARANAKRNPADPGGRAGPPCRPRRRYRSPASARLTSMSR